ncbi:uncharacterized protein PAC_05229 [Phialocephala subalpina]|uniref:Uncharacterized protein n=1 Tax=Phialocephala subalpina TaxID=576137 RepID=A0A1L7WRE2_9HELO|nr:uncharacterized protein PAC_05229 [Phialocephala subalpina]
MSGQSSTEVPKENWGLGQKFWQGLTGSKAKNKGIRKESSKKKKSAMKSTPNPRNSPSKMPKVIWAEQKRREDDPAEHAKRAVNTLSGISIDSEQWTDEHPALLQENIAAVLESLATNEEEKKCISAQNKALRVKAAKVSKRSIVTPEDREVIQEPEPETDDNEDGGDGYGSGDGHDSPSPTPDPPNNKRKFKDYQNPEHDVQALTHRLVKQPQKMQRLNTIMQTQAPTDLPTLNPQPIRINYDPHPLEDQSDEWFMGMFKNLFKQIEKFVCQFYTIHDLDKGAFYEPWAAGFSTEFTSWAEQVAEPDPIMGGWDNILRNTQQRQWFIMGILMRIIQKKIFDEDLFGSNQQQQELMHGLDRALFAREGFSRQALRSETVRTIIGRAPVTELFYHEVAQLTARVSLLFYPLTSYLYQLAPPQGSKIPQVVDLYQALHSLISNAAYLSFSMRLSPTIFYITPLSPGDVYSAEDHLNFSMLSYTASKQAVVDQYAAATMYHKELSNPQELLAKRLKKKGMEHTAQGKAASTLAAEIKTHAPTNPGNTHRAMVGIASWPVVTRFTPGGEEDDENSPGGVAYLPDKDGFRIFQISKGGGVFYYGRERRGGDMGERTRLRHWAREKERAMKAANAKSTGAVNVKGMVVGWAAVAAVATVGFALQERSMDQVINIAREIATSVIEKL